MKNRPIIILLLCLVCGNALMAQKSIPKNYQKKYTKYLMPSFVDDQYVDFRQISNIDWMEFQFWLEHVFGADSKEYKASIPDKEVLRQQLPEKIAEVYADSPFYKDYPVLGVSREQAVAYCKWRTDRVAEQMLVDMRFIQYDPNQTKDNYFTLDNYEAVEGLQFLRFSLSTTQCETRYGFRCTSVWR